MEPTTINQLIESITGFSIIEIINVKSITMASIIPTMIGAFFYFVLSRYTINSSKIFIIVGSLFALISCAGAFGDSLPNGLLL